MAEASMITACLIGRGFSLVTFSNSLAGWFAECVRSTVSATVLRPAHAD
jgi:Asp/Glu/hydantoin racemase